ncbi:SDR family NAD(P)-dependent oxidoreductase [Defluviimonas sp. D31]|uniref:SDR family NAD(P)-dependent oxidoreductase n=1 Tax=Defluviimonas sp. D31 TaxID=3083253 RepID=UPI00296EDADB|nr:SDR family NAD(P)-dependent oxidoreductase [Defluviimonas sp. D31]MDW4550562.1 SDR family NAD(P)-dependent oxidoreductase [Defluviimonas sp. D31]
MTYFAGKTYWLIGASEGLGRELARMLDAEGAHVVLSARNADRLESLCAELSHARVHPLDVTDSDAVRRAAAELGPVEGIIYNAATYDPVRATEWDSDAVLSMCDVNFVGALRVLGEIVPRFVKAEMGDITLIGSLAAYSGLPASIGYGASKAALLSLAETMRHDLKGSGVVVRIVNPGFIKSRLTEKNAFKMPMIMSPEDAASRVLKAMRKNRFRSDFPAPFSWFIRSLVFLPDLLVYRGK